MTRKLAWMTVLGSATLGLGVACGGGGGDGVTPLEDAGGASTSGASSTSTSGNGTTSSGAASSSGASSGSTSSGSTSGSTSSGSTSSSSGSTSSSSSSSGGTIDGGVIVITSKGDELAAGGQLACAVPPGGGPLKCWGNNKPSPFIVSPGTNFTDVSIAQYAYYGGCAISTDNALICFTGADLTPSQIDTGTFRQVANGNFVRCAIATSGKLYCMGQTNGYGQLGTGDTDPHAGLTPVKTDATNWRYVTTSSNHTCALDETGALYCWGYGATGALGDGGGDGGNQYYVSVPQRVEPGTVYLDVDAKNTTTCAVTSEGALTCTGNGYYYASASKTMKTLDTASDWAKVRLGSTHACALKRTGKMYCWGSNANGQIGQPASNQVYQSPQQVGTDTNWVDVAVGDDFSCGRKADGSVRCWGSNGANQLGQADSGHLSPKLVGNAGEWKYVGAGSSGVCAVKTDGSLFCWGNYPGSTYGVRTQTPAQVGTSKSWETVVTTGDRACGTQTGGALYCWGTSFGNTTPSAVGYSNVTSIALGAEHQCFISGGSLSCWGDGIFGKLCNGGSDEAAPKAVPTNTYLTVAAGDEDTCAVQSDGTMHCCGFGYGTLEKIGTATNWTSAAVAVNGEDYFGLQGTGALYTWSWIDDVTASGTVVDWKSFVVGSGHRCGIRADNSLDCFGSNNAGQLGDGTTTSKSAPVQVGSATDWSQVAVGASFTCGLRGNDLYCWGDNSQGQIGDGSAWSETPVTVQ